MKHATAHANSRCTPVRKSCRKMDYRRGQYAGMRIERPRGRMPRGRDPTRKSIFRETAGQDFRARFFGTFLSRDKKVRNKVRFS